MPTFTYKAKKGLNETVEGIIDAENRDIAATLLSDTGLVPIKIELHADTKLQAKKQKNSKKGRLGSKELGIFTTQLKTLIKAKVELLSCLSILYKQSDNPSLKEVVHDLHNGVKDGKSFSEGLSKFPNFFPSLYVNVIKAGETSGRLDEALSELSSFLEKEQDLRLKIQTALAYPIMMIVVGIGTIFVLFSFVIPRISGIFADFQASLPLPTRILIKISDFFQHAWFVIAALAIFVIFLIRKNMASGKRNSFDLIKIHLPVIGELIRKQAISRFSHTLAMLLHSGIPVFQSFSIAIPTLENRIFIQQLEAAHKEILSGSSLANSLKKTTFIPQFIIQMITVGEEGGRLEEVLNEIVTAYTQETEAILKIITSLIEPLVILCLGLVLGLIIMAMLLPIFEINMLVK